MAFSELKVPQVSQVCALSSSLPCTLANSAQAELTAFHDAHFGAASLNTFDSDFLQPEPSHEDGTYYEAEEEDDLGYYPDGVKRTLTDEQIAIFRHSEEQALLREQEKQSARETPIVEAPAGLPKPELADEGEIEEGMIVEAQPPKKKKKRKNKSREPKPDLRKRTWDMVDTGLGSLDYDDMEGSQSPAPQQAQRRRISYDD